MMRPSSSRAAILVALAVLIAYAPSLGGGWLWCDDLAVGESEQHTPVTSAAHWLLLRAFGPSPLAFRSLALLLHAAAAVLLGTVARRLGLSGAFLGAAVFALHPLCVESAAWVYETKNPLSLALAALSFHAWLSFEEGKRPRRALACALALFAAALLAKPSVVVLPAIMCLALILRGRIAPRSLASLAPFAALAGACAAVTLAIEPELLPGEGPSGFGERFAVAGHVFWLAVEKTILPLSLSFSYERLDPAAAPLAPALLAALAVVVSAGAAALARGAARAAGLAVLAFAAALLPVLGFFDIYMMRYAFFADHLAYPAVAVAALAAGPILASRRAAPAALLLLAVLGASAATRAATFRSEEALWREAAERSPRSWLAQLEVGLAEKRAGRIEAAIDRFRRARAERETVDALVNLGNALVDAGRPEEALAPLGRAREISPGDAANHANAARALAALGRLDEAIAAYRLAALFEPEDPLIRSNLAALVAARGAAPESPPR